MDAANRLILSPEQGVVGLLDTRHNWRLSRASKHDAIDVEALKNTENVLK
jgi:hypothetical protein